MTLIRFLIRNFIAIVATFALWTILYVIGWTSPLGYFALGLVFVVFVRTFRSYALEGEKLGTADIEVRKARAMDRGVDE
jgi:L-cystine uptake protein TcyP (sodium:dicarboxylate symporter family)